MGGGVGDVGRNCFLVVVAMEVRQLCGGADDSCCNCGISGCSMNALLKCILGGGGGGIFLWLW